MPARLTDKTAAMIPLQPCCGAQQNPYTYNPSVTPVRPLRNRTPRFPPASLHCGSSDQIPDRLPRSAFTPLASSSVSICLYTLSIPTTNASSRCSSGTAASPLSKLSITGRIFSMILLLPYRTSVFFFLCALTEVVEFCHLTF